MKLVPYLSFGLFTYVNYIKDTKPYLIAATALSLSSLGKAHVPASGFSASLLDFENRLACILKKLQIPNTIITKNRICILIWNQC